MLKFVNSVYVYFILAFFVLTIYNISMNKVIRVIPFLMFVLLAGLFISSSNLSINSGSAHATQASTNTEIALNVDSVINISAPTTATINCNPGATAAAAQLCTTNVTVGVGTNNITGYTLQMNATSGSPTALTNSAASPAATIPTLFQAYSSSNFPINSWGYTGGLDKSSETGGYDCSTNYCPILAYNSDSSSYAPNHVIKVTDAPSTTSNTDITFGAKVDISKPSGTYSTSVTFTAVTNEVPITTMQDFDSAACANATMDQTFTLTDTRDNTEYTVAKLQDGNCWMTQNLALGGSTAMNLTQADSNVGPSGFTLPASVTEGSWAGSLDSPEFFDYAGNYPSQQATNKYGNYYNWNAATAGSGTSATISSDASHSICPKNWRLPSVGTDVTTDNEFYTMLNNYISGATWNLDYYWSDVPTSQFTTPPISLVFSGGYYGDVYSQSDSCTWWASTASVEPTDSFFSYADSDGNIYPRYDENKRTGQSIRCLVPST